MSKQKTMTSFRATDGTHWGVDVQLPGASNALVLFHHPDGRTARKDRYAWVNWHGREALDVKARIDRNAVQESLHEAEIEALFTRSMAVGNGRGPSFSAA